MSEPTEREYLEGLRYEDKFPDPTDRTRAFAYANHVTDILDMSQDARCPDCHGPLVYNHDVFCPGPLQRVWWPVQDDPYECDCPPGWHLPDCELVA